MSFVPDPGRVASFRREVMAYYRAHGRDGLPWRRMGSGRRLDPYHVLVSELMLQQTQVQRVEAKYPLFLERFPDTVSLARAPLSAVLIEWQGLGYNRRARYLWQAAQEVQDRYGGVIPAQVEQLVSLPGIGLNTAGAIVAYAYDRPVVFVETNIRTAVIHHFFAGQTGVSDRDVRTVMSASLPGKGVRHWYWALMDYGSHLKRTTGNLSQASRTYRRQSAFEGSRRQLRGGVLKVLTGGPVTPARLRELLPDLRLEEVVEELCREEMIVERDGRLALYDR